MSKIKLKSLGTEKAKLEKEIAVLIKRLKLSDNSGEGIFNIDLQTLISSYVLNLDQRQVINELIGVQVPAITDENNPETSKVDISLKNGIGVEVESNIIAVLKSKGASDEVAEKLVTSILDVIKKSAETPTQFTISRLMKNKVSFSVNKVTHSVPIK